ncbi:hypothetical protein GCM10022419_029600 [Nonomuraea rosea]|uniref:Peptidoglycan binding-like domain-containing protein n=1 Tax=Nonomuraea rosea TaxID=638574 RepID=A0ABP6WAU5_9ACTN
MLEDLDQVFAWLLATLLRPTSGLYGEFDLQPGDQDPAPGRPARYGGQERPALGDATHVRDLHRDLREMGFLLAPQDATTFTTATWLTVMEFQRYSSLPDSAAEREPAAGILSEALTVGGGIAKVGPGTAFPADPPFRVRIDDEVLEIIATRGPGVAGSAGGLRVVRGVEGTTAAAHAKGAPVELIRWSDRLVPVPARFYERYAEPITGVVNAWTRFVLRRWKQKRRRCPVVVEAWEMREGQPDRIHLIPASDGLPARRADNVWGHAEVVSTAPRFYVRDLTRTWPRPARPPVAPAHPELDVTGDYRVLGDYSGPRSWPELGHTWRPEGEMLPEHLLPVSATNASARDRSARDTSAQGASEAGAPARSDSADSHPAGSASARGTSARSGSAGSASAWSGVAAGAAAPRAQGPTLQELLDSGEPAALSTYKVVRAVSEVEAVGYFDGLNAYDRAFISLGPCHWTAGLTSAPAPASPVEGGELWGFVSFLKSADRVAFVQALGRFGVDAATPWGKNGADLFNPSQRKYSSRPTVPKEGGGRRDLGTVEEYDMFRGWHWFYRLQMATRTVDGFRRAMWHMARLRIRDIGETPWDGPADPPVWTVPDPQAPGGSRPARIKDVINSERGMAIVYRWHIRAPANMVSAGPATEAPATRRIGRAGPVLRAVYEAAAKDNATLFAGTPDIWGDAAEQALITQLRRQGGASVEYVHEWPRLASRNRGFTLPVEILPEASDGEGRRLGLARRSFVLDTTGLSL